MQGARPGHHRSPFLPGAFPTFCTSLYQAKWYGGGGERCVLQGARPCHASCSSPLQPVLAEKATSSCCVMVMVTRERSGLHRKVRHLEECSTASPSRNASGLRPPRHEFESLFSRGAWVGFSLPGLPCKVDVSIIMGVPAMLPSAPFFGGGNLGYKYE